jgi:hypothetical protein
MSKTAHDTAYASHDAGLREMERDAFEHGNMIFRDWCDSKKIERTKIMENKTMKIKIKKGVKEVVNKDKADLDKDGKLSSYETKRGDAIEKAMGVQEAHGDPEELDFGTLPKSHRKAGMTDFEMDPSADDEHHGEEEKGEEEVEVSPFENAQSLAAQIKAALADGVVPGGGTALYRVSLNHREESNTNVSIARDIVRQAVQAPFIKILANAGVENWWEYTPTGSPNEVYDAKNHKTVDAFEAGIIDPAKVVITALKNAASVAGTILTTETVIFEKKEKDEKSPDPMTGMM